MLDGGCSPGRMVKAAMALGLCTLGIGVVDRHANCGGIGPDRLLNRSILDRVPREGSWAMALLVDGHIGIGEDPEALLTLSAEPTTHLAGVREMAHPTSCLTPKKTSQQTRGWSQCLERERELGEELGLVVGAETLEWVGRFGAPATNEPGHLVDCDVFRLAGIDTVTAGAEIEQARWFNRESLADVALAPLTATNLDAFFN